MNNSISFVTKIIKIFAFIFNIYLIILGLAMISKHPESTIGASLICDIFNMVVYAVLMKKKYNHYSYRDTRMSDRALIRTMAIAAVMLPCSLLSSPVYFILAIIVISQFLPTSSQMESMLKCDQWSLVRKAKEQEDADKVEKN